MGGWGADKPTAAAAAGGLSHAHPLPNKTHRKARPTPHRTRVHFNPRFVASQAWVPLEEGACPDVPLPCARSPSAQDADTLDSPPLLQQILKLQALSLDIEILYPKVQEFIRAHQNGLTAQPLDALRMSSGPRLRVRGREGAAVAVPLSTATANSEATNLLLESKSTKL